MRVEERYRTVVERRPEDLAVMDDRGRRLSHRELWEAAGEVSAMLETEGVSSGDVVLVFLPNWIDWMV